VEKAIVNAVKNAETVGGIVSAKDVTIK